MLGFEYNAMYVDGIAVGLIAAYVVLALFSPRESVKDFVTDFRAGAQVFIFVVLFGLWMYHPPNTMYASTFNLTMTMILFIIVLIEVNNVRWDQQKQRERGYEDAIAKLNQFEGGSEYAKKLSQFEYDDTHQYLTESSDLGSENETEETE